MLEFFTLVVVASASGVFSPGPLFFSTIENALRNGGWSGWLVAAGHMAFEFPLVLAIAYGIRGMVENPLIRFWIGVFGAMAIMAFGGVQAYLSYRDMANEGVHDGSRITFYGGKGSWMMQSFMIGLTFTGLNPYFLIWWFTMGLTLITNALEVASLIGVLIMYAFHIWLDYAWLGFVSHTAAVGSKPLKPKHLNILSLILSVILVILGVKRLISVIISL